MSVVQLLQPEGDTHQNHSLATPRRVLSESVSHEEAIGSNLRARILSFGIMDNPDASPTTVLACALSLAHPIQIAEILATQLMDAFASIGAVLSAPLERVRLVIPHSEITFLVLRAMQTLLSFSLKEQFERKVDISSYASLNAYLRSALAHKDVEVVRLLLMDAHNGLIRDELHAQGSGDRVTVSPRDIVRRAIDVGAYGVIIVHNHPSGDPTPSVDDVEMTKELEQALKYFRVILHDSIIIGKCNSFSLKLNGLL